MLGEQFFKPFKVDRNSLFEKWTVLVAKIITMIYILSHDTREPQIFIISWSTINTIIYQKLVIDKIAGALSLVHVFVLIRICCIEEHTETYIHTILLHQPFDFRVFSLFCVFLILFQFKHIGIVKTIGFIIK